MLSWTRLRGPNRCCRTAVAVGQRIYCFDGLHGEDMAVHIFDAASSSWSELPLGTSDLIDVVPTVPYKSGHTAVLVGNIIYFWGGLLRTFRAGQVHAFDVNAHRWLKRKASGAAPAPEERTNHSACVLGRFMYIYGGVSTWDDDDGDNTWFNDVHKLDTATMIWTSIVPGGDPPPNLMHHSATFMGTKMFVFGGFNREFHHSPHHDDGYYVGCYHYTVRVFDTETDCWLKTIYTLPVPDGRAAHAAFARHGELYIFGGQDYDASKRPRVKDDMWKFNPRAVSWKKVEPKGESPSQSLQKGIAWCCTVGDRIITYTDDLYVLDLTHLSPDCPSLKALCMGSVVQYGADWSELPHDVRLELTAMTTDLKKIREKAKKDHEDWLEAVSYI